MRYSKPLHVTDTPVFAIVYEMDKYRHLINKIIVMDYCRLSLSSAVNQFARLDYILCYVELFVLLIYRIDTLSYLCIFVNYGERER